MGSDGVGYPRDRPVMLLPGRSNEVCEIWMTRVKGGSVDKAPDPWDQGDQDSVIATCQSGCEG